MKHTFKITLLLLFIFLLSQFIGLGVLYKYIDQEKSQKAGKTIFKELPFGERPPLEKKTSFLWVMLAILIGTSVLLFLIKFKIYFLWKIWFLIAVVLALTFSWGAFIEAKYALLLALFFGSWKVFRPNPFIQNFTEIFIYSGLAVIFVPLFNLGSIILLLLLVSLYDFYAVWKSKHMITLAEAQSKAKVFAGLLIPYETKRKVKKTKITRIFPKKEKTKKRTERLALLGGGDIGFPLIFAGVVLAKGGLGKALVIPFFSGLALFILLLKGKKKKFYPAMPFLTLGCLIGLALVWWL